MLSLIGSMVSLIVVFLMIFVCFDAARFIRNFIKVKFQKLLKKEDFTEIKQEHKKIPLEMVEVKQDDAEKKA